ncbi:hypothetical protein HYFRA_00010199 [Hymenoscyphus fraxineus]|uniref:Uncharacterized protein n=1 Tax=Hymenoscyphus fraxineus TaxID=746836 RepID=A0A9N9PHS4_9HELO|nr:hypothetical protein HYFRA_00010199 [Hymenoscyphus fraxineus]
MPSQASISHPVSLARILISDAYPRKPPKQGIHFPTIKTPPNPYPLVLFPHRDKFVGHTAPATIYFNTNTVTPPAIPPAKLAKPRKRTTRAFHATPEPEYENESAESRVFSIELMISIPSAEKIRGSQSMKRMWIGGSEPLSGECEKTEASRRMKNARENWGEGVSRALAM